MPGYLSLYLLLSSDGQKLVNLCILSFLYVVFVVLTYLFSKKTKQSKDRLFTKRFVVSSGYMIFMHLVLQPTTFQNGNSRQGNQSCHSQLQTCIHLNGYQKVPILHLALVFAVPTFRPNLDFLTVAVNQSPCFKTSHQRPISDIKDTVYMFFYSLQAEPVF